MQAHTGPVTQLEWNEDKQQLMTGSKDKTIKIWKFPEVWVDEQSVVKRAVPHHEKQEETKSESTPISLDDESPTEPGMPSL